MMDAQIGKRYAVAIYDIAEKSDKVKDLHSDLNTVMELYIRDEEFKNLVDHPLVKKEEKKKILSDVLKGMDEFGMNIVDYLVDKGRLSNIRSIVAEYVKVYYEKNQIVDVLATFALEPSEDQKSKLIEKLEKKTGKKVNLEVNIDTNIIAGGIIKIGDEIIDGSLRRQLDTLAKN